MNVAWYWWAVFVAVIVGLLLVDLLLVHREAHEVRTKEAATWSAIWIALGLAFAAVVWPWKGGEAAQSYLTGYLLEKSLSVDNLFVFVLIFKYFQVPAKYQHRVLFYGILGALVFRGAFIGLGVVLLEHFSWIAFVFGAFLVATGVRIATQEEVEVHPDRNPVLNALRRVMPVTRDFRGQSLIVRDDGRLKATPLLAVLVVIETTDVIFAIDSIPAIFGITRDPFIVFTSNAFAILGLRALYFLLADVVRRFRYLDYGLGLVLGIVGLKMIYEELVAMHEEGGVQWLPEELIVEIPPAAPLVLVAVVLGAAIAVSFLRQGDEVR